MDREDAVARRGTLPGRRFDDEVEGARERWRFLTEPTGASDWSAPTACWLAEILGDA